MRRISGEVALGDGPESLRADEDNQYRPAWLPIGELDEVDLRPRGAAGIITGAIRGRER